ncbi:hypothetical protein UACE39S_05998 [Ureibacillus acetophenoni]
MTTKFTPYTWFLFIVLSVVGIFLFITPIDLGEGLKVPIAILANTLSANVVSFIHWFAFIVFIIAAIGSIIMHFIPAKKERTLMDSLFRVHWFWTTMRILAVIFAAMYIGVEPVGAASMKAALENGGPIQLPKIDKFCDGTAVQMVGSQTYEICKQYLDDIVVVPEGKASTTLLDLYNKHAIVAEPSGALPVAALDLYADKIKGKTAVVIITGGNNDIARMAEIKEKSLLYEGLLHYFIVNFPQRAGALRQFLTVVLGPNDDITTFEYTKKNNKESGPALVGIELSKPEDYQGLIDRMRINGFEFTEVNKDSQLFGLLV